MGDWSAKIGKRQDKIVNFGKYGYGKQNKKLGCLCQDTGG